MSIKNLPNKIKYPLFFILFSGVFFLILVWRLNRIFYATPQMENDLVFVVESGESARALVERLSSDGKIKNKNFFLLYLRIFKLDRRIMAGEKSVSAPVTIAKIASAFAVSPARPELVITLRPGETLRNFAEHLVEVGLAEEVEEVYEITGVPAEKRRFELVGALKDIELLKSKPSDVSLEGYLAPETIRVFADATIAQVVAKFVSLMEKNLTDDLISAAAERGMSRHDLLTMAGLIEREVPHPEDMTKVADLFYRRLSAGWLLQADSTVHYATGRSGSVFTTAAERASQNLWNTYKYKGLPPGAIGAPSIEAMRAAAFPEKNDYWFFLTTLDTGEVKYAVTLDEHNQNARRYLR